MITRGPSGFPEHLQGDPEITFKIKKWVKYMTEHDHRFCTYLAFGALVWEPSSTSYEILMVILRWPIAASDWTGSFICKKRALTSLYYLFCPDSVSILINAAICTLKPWYVNTGDIIYFVYKQHLKCSSVLVTCLWCISSRVQMTEYLTAGESLKFLVPFSQKQTKKIKPVNLWDTTSSFQISHQIQVWNYNYQRCLMCT